MFSFQKNLMVYTSVYEKCQTIDNKQENNVVRIESLFNLLMDGILKIRFHT